MASYVTVADANSFFKFHPYKAEWEALSPTDKTDLLDYATNIIDRAGNLFDGVKTDTQQELEFPRNGETTIPRRVKDATLEVAVFQILKMKNKKHMVAQDLKMTGMGVGSVNFSYKDSASGSSALPDVAWELLTPYLILYGGVR